MINVQIPIFDFIKNKKPITRICNPCSQSIFQEIKKKHL